MDVEREWLDLVGHLLATPLTALPEERLATALMLTFDAPACAFHARPGPRRVVQRIYPAGLFGAALQAEWLRLSVESAALHPLLQYYLATGDGAPQQVADVPSAFTDSRTPDRWIELSHCRGFEHQLAIPLLSGVAPHRPEGPRWFVLGRAEPFPPERMLLARRVQRLIVGLDRQAAALTRWQSRAATSEAPAVAANIRLTPRELSVLGLVADGLTAGAAARRLLVAERTVHKHLERVYAKLGVSDRVSAVLQAQRLGLLPEAVAAG